MALRKEKMSDELFNFENLKGHTLVYVEVKKGDGGDVVLFRDSDGTLFEMYHDQDCCETVWLDDQCGSWQDILNTPILSAHVVESEQCRGCTWTFYTLVTFYGSMTLRWIGESNGYYSERVSFYKH